MASISTIPSKHQVEHDHKQIQVNTLDEEPRARYRCKHNRTDNYTIFRTQLRELQNLLQLSKECRNTLDTLECPDKSNAGDSESVGDNEYYDYESENSEKTSVSTSAHS